MKDSKDSNKTVVSVNFDSVRNRPNFKSLLAVIPLVLLLVGIIRITNSRAAISFNDLLSFLESFDMFNGIVSKIAIPELTITGVPKFLQWAVSVVNTGINLINIFWTIGTLLWRALFVLLNIFSWILFGVTI